MRLRLRRWLRQVTGHHPMQVERLPGATTADVQAFRAGGSSLVVKDFRWPHVDGAEHVTHEAGALEHIARVSAVTVPTVVAVDATGEHAGHPALVMTRLDDQRLTEAPSEPALAATAELARAIHRIPTDGIEWHHERYVEPAQTFQPSWFDDAVLWRAVVEAAGAAPDVVSTFIHRDLHHGNIVWVDGLPAGVVDWSLACRGPAAEDFGRVACNLALQFDVETAERFCVQAGDDFEVGWAMAAWLDMIPFYDGPDQVEDWLLPDELARHAALAVRWLG